MENLPLVQAPIHLNQLRGLDRTMSHFDRSGSNSAARERDDSSADRDSVIGYYTTKTKTLLEKYGPDPGVHFHVGYFDDSPIPSGSETFDEIRSILRKSQQRMMVVAAERWQAERRFRGHLLDAGCGLGGGSIYWAANYPVTVTAVTIVPDHLAIINAHARELGVGDRIRPVCADVLTYSPDVPHDVVVSMEAACYWDLFKWFERLAATSAPGGLVCIEDSVLGDPRAKAVFDSYWRTNISSLETYVSAAGRAGFELISDDDLTDATTPFWAYSVAYSDAKSRVRDISDSERHRLVHSSATHAQMYDFWRDHAVEIRLLAFRRK